MLSEKDFAKIKDELDNCSRPLFLFDDDPDGLAAFLLLYRYKREGHGIAVKARPRVDKQFARKVEEYNADKVFVLDLSSIDSDFVDSVNVPIVWIDHHEPQEVSGVKYFNPRCKDPDANYPTSYLCYQVVKQDLWISVAGCIGDWFVPDTLKEFRKEFPKLVDKKLKTAPDVLFGSPLGKIVHLFSFNLKGKTSEVQKSVKMLTRVEGPEDLLGSGSGQGKLLYKKYLSVKEHYDKLLAGIEKGVTEDVILLHIYHDNKISLTKDLANELLYKYPGKVIILGREKNGEMKCSLRSSGKVILPPLLQEALVGVQGYGGGHEHACGCCVKAEDFERFVEQLREAVLRK